MFAHLYGFKYSYQIQIISKSFTQDGALTSSTTSTQSGTGSNGNKGALHTHKISRTGALQPDGGGFFPQHKADS